VPCGGRPEAVNISNVSNLIDAEGKPNFKYVVEGANLFFTQQARLFLEKKGVVLFKDSSTNKVSSPLYLWNYTHNVGWCHFQFLGSPRWSQLDRRGIHRVYDVQGWQAFCFL